MPVEVIEVPGGESLVRMRGDFTAPEAWKVCELLSSHGDGPPVILDFTQVHRCEDFAVALLAPQLITCQAHHIRLRGLGLHHRRLLEYFGVRGATLAEGARGDVDQPAAHA